MSWFTDQGYNVILDPNATPDRQLTNEIDPNDPYAGSDSYYNGGSEGGSGTQEGYVPTPSMSLDPLRPQAPVQSGSFVNTSPNQGLPNPVGPGGTNTGTASNSSDPISFIRQYQATHPFSLQAVDDLRNQLQAMGYGRWAGTSNNEVDLHGQKTKFYSEGGNSWYDPAGGSDDGGGSGFGNLSSIATSPFTAPAPFDYPSFTPPAPFTPPNYADIANDPAYKFALGQGLQAVDRSAAANGTLNTGATPKAEAGYATGLATQYSNDVFNRDYQTYGLNYSNLADVYNTNRNNAASNYLTNYNVATGTWDRNRLAGLDAYGQGQDYLGNLFKLAGYGQSSTGVQAPYTGTA